MASAVAAFFKKSLPTGRIAVAIDRHGEVADSPEVDQLAREFRAVKVKRSAVVACDAATPHRCQLRGVSVLVAIHIRVMTASAAEAALAWETAGAHGQLSFSAFRVALERREGRWIVVRVLGQEAT
ncbi:MAG: hypothetical protein IT359_10595 [Gemmatimonadaceae bacterium]|nr:hypothetical protein [Gemmatimonadaceae bacterium]